jgi:hypothetical protein
MRTWREASHDEPPAALDDAIRAAARQAVHARPRPIAGSPFGSRWRVPLSVAAVLVVSATVTLLVAERERHSSRSLHEQAALPAAPAPLAHTGEPAAERSKTPARQFAEPGAPAPVISAAPRERESSRTLEESKTVLSAPSAPSSSAENSLRRARPRGESAAQIPSREPAPVEADRSEGQRADTQQHGAVSVPPAPAAAPPAQRADDALRDTARPATDEPVADLAKRENRAAAKGERAARGAPAAPTAMEPSPQSGQQAAAPKPKAQAFPAAPPTQASPEGPAADATQYAEPKVWLERILELRRQGKLEEADKSLKAFRERYPAYPLPLELKSSP